MFQPLKIADYLERKKFAKLSCLTHDGYSIFSDKTPPSTTVYIKNFDELLWGQKFNLTDFFFMELISLYVIFYLIFLWQSNVKG